MPDNPRKKPDLPESTLRIMERMVKAPPVQKGGKPKSERKPKKEKPAK